MSKANLRKFDPVSDKRSVYEIYQEVLGVKWPLDQDSFNEVLDHKSTVAYVAIVSGKAVGFIITQTNSNSRKGSLILICVKKEFQRKRIGSELVHISLGILNKRGVKQVQLGAGGKTYLWPGVPTNLPQAIRFFKSCGFKYSETSYDLIGDLSQYSTPSWVYERTQKYNIGFQLANEKDADKILEFEKKHFPEWYDPFSAKIENKDYGDILYAKDNEILGTVLLTSRDSNFKGTILQWQGILGLNMGGFGALGITKNARDKGIGMGLAARASEILKQMSVEKCFLGWTWLVEWYAKLGYKVWREYKMSWKNL
ncbi:MAG: GNAT family N-acetyltransferase [Patescibacteria group bacterium]|nr:GNAT family N-acetyltransferase [Patescibacteria group bacterium]